MFWGVLVYLSVFLSPRLLQNELIFLCGCVAISSSPIFNEFKFVAEITLKIINNSLKFVCDLTVGRIHYISGKICIIFCI